MSLQLRIGRRSASGGKQRSLKRKASLIEPPKFRNRQWVRLPNMPSNDGYHSIQNPNSSNIDEAQMLLDDVASSMSLRLSKRPKLEPVEPSLVESPDREDSIASSRTSSGRPPPGLPTKPTSLGIVNNSDAATPMSISSDQPSLVPPPTTPLLPPPDAQNGNHEPVSLPPDFIIQTKPTSFGYHKSPTPPGLTMHARQHPPELPQSRSASQSHSSQTPRNLTPDHDSPAPRRPKPEDVPKIRKLSRELCDLRRHVTAAVTRETAILNELNALNSPPITESSVHIKSSDDESLLKTRLQAVEKTLKEERRRRMDAEATLKDIQRECREPFVVPALLDAFITVSKITSQAMDTNVKT